MKMKLRLLDPAWSPGGCHGLFSGAGRLNPRKLSALETKGTPGPGSLLGPTSLWQSQAWAFSSAPGAKKVQI